MVAGVLWCMVWWWLAYDTPESHRHIRESERKYIISAIQTQQTGTQYAPVPWGALATSAPLWAIIVAHMCNNWAFYTLLTGLSTYLHVALGVKTDDGGLDATLPYISIFLTALGIGPLTDWLRKSKGVRTGVARRVNTTIAFAVGAGCLALTGMSGCLHCNSIASECGITSRRHHHNTIVFESVRTAPRHRKDITLYDV